MKNMVFEGKKRVSNRNIKVLIYVSSTFNATCDFNMAVSRLFCGSYYFVLLHGVKAETLFYFKGSFKSISSSKNGSLHFMSENVFSFFP